MNTNENQMQLRAFNPDDAETILSWCKDKHAFRLWSADRYKDFPALPEEMMEQYQKTGGVMNEEQLTKAIASVTQLPEKGAIVGGTLWTMVMDLKHPSVTYYSRRHFDKPLHFELSQTN